MRTVMMMRSTRGTAPNQRPARNPSAFSAFVPPSIEERNFRYFFIF